ncbi:ATP-binding cassette domain-containing protein [Streptomyces sp. NPDC002044]|uniref:ABC transporter ATP-binding protein n=1 Tax=Streptomyces sp. NPDC002044 TaxID=3154662 RepID=UPI00331E558C
MYAMVAPPDNDVLWARSLHYSHSGSPGLIGVSVGVRQGEILAVTGPRGSGKTTLLRCLSGQLAPEQGEVWFNSLPVHTLGEPARERMRRDRFGWIGPEPALLPELKVWENAALPLLLTGASHRTAKHAACAWLERLDIGAFAGKRPSALTRAECQRVALARALVGEPAVLFADEPTAPLHRAERTLLLRTLTTAARSHEITVVLATHDEETAAAADRRLALLDGRSAETAEAADAAAQVTEAAPDSPGSPAADTTEDQAACSLSA